MTVTQLDKQMESEVVLTALTHLTKGEITDVIACFAERFEFNDRGLGLKFNNPRRLAEFFRKERELYPDSSLQTDKIIVSGNHVIIEWTLRNTLTEPFYGGLKRKVPIELHGASVVRTANGKITGWTDYYDGLASRRTSLAAHFEEWVEL
jgi:ketosteroid isomerase-like protein